MDPSNAGLLPGHNYTNTSMHAWRPTSTVPNLRLATQERAYTPLSARDPANVWNPRGRVAHGRISPSRSGAHSLPLWSTASPNSARDYGYGSDSVIHSRRASVTSQFADPPLTLPLLENTGSGLSKPGVGNHPDSVLRPLPVNAGFSAPSPLPTALPSFSSLKESTSRDVGASKRFGVIAMEQRERCETCLRTEPLVRDAVVVAVELYRSVQKECNRSHQQRPEPPGGNSLRTLQWIIENLRFAKDDLDTRQQTVLKAEPQDFPFRDDMIPAPRKRAAESIEGNDYHVSKRYKSVSIDDGLRSTANAVHAADEYSSHRDDQSWDNHKQGYASPPSDSLPGSSHAGHASPSVKSPWNQPSHSPMSLPYAPSGGRARTVTSVLSAYSPTSHYRPPAQAPASSSPASQHVAELQHQVTLKSLALQTLQSEHSSTLQKLQRERVKIQAIGKKASVSEQEINDLTGRNEDLADHVKSLEVSLAESEKKRDNERAEITREREQWGRMLDMGGRLQAKNAVDRKRLSEQILQLEQRLQKNEQSSAPPGHDQSSPSERNTDDSAQSVGATATVSPALPGLVAYDGSSVVATQLDNSNLRSRVDVLRFALEELSRQSAQIQSQEREAMNARTVMSEAVRRALDEDDAMQRSETGGGSRKGHSKGSPPSRSNISAMETSTPNKTSLATNANAAGSTNLGGTLPAVGDSTGTRPYGSPHPVQSDAGENTTPEKLVKALGPVPGLAALPSWISPHTLMNPASRNKMREPSGPSTPYPGTESTGWRAFSRGDHIGQAQVTSPNSVPAGGLATSGSSPGRQPNSQKSDEIADNKSSAQTFHQSDATAGGQGRSQVPNMADMPPPPRPMVVSAQLASWRPS